LFVLFQTFWFKPSNRAAGSLMRWWLPSVLAAAVFVFEFLASESRGSFLDFKNAYYLAGLDVRDGTSLAPLLSEGVVGFVNLPIVAYLFWPFSFLPWKVAASGPFLVIGIGATGAAYMLLVRLLALPRPASVWLLLLFLFDGPLIYSIKIANTSHMILLALVGALWLLRKRKSALAGVLLAFAALIKLPLLLFGGFFLIRRDWSGGIAFAATLLAAAALSLLVFGPELHLLWLDSAILQFGHSTLAAFNVQSFPAALARLREPAPALFDWSTLEMSRSEKVLSKLFQVAILVFTIWGLLLCRRFERENIATAKVEASELQFLLVLCCALVISPLSWSHYYCWLLLPAAYALRGQAPRGTPAIIRWMSVAAVMLVTPLVIFPDHLPSELDTIYTRLVVSNYLIGGVLWLGVLVMTALAVAGSGRPSSNRL
jgi:hypothetical protein